MLVDTHCHLHDREFFSKEQAEKMLERAHECGVKKIICIGTSIEDSLVAQDFSNTHKDVYWTFGIHPESAGLDYEMPHLNSDKLVAIGEVGLDYHLENHDKKAQIRLLNEMLQIAQDKKLPVSFHMRNAFEDFFGVIANFPKVTGVIHSFTDSKKSLNKILNETNFYIGVNGLATYSTLPTPPLERILLETDAPFLTPTPFRGIINEPRYIYEIAEWLSRKLGLDFSIVEKETTNNAKRLFKF